MSALNEILNRIILQVWHATGIAEHESCWDEEMKVHEESPVEDSKSNSFTIDYKGEKYQVLVRKII